MDYGKNEYAEEIKNQTEKLARLTDKLIFLAKTEEPSAYPFSKFDLSASLKKVISTYEKIFISKGFDFSYSVEEGTSINGNEELIERFYREDSSRSPFKQTNGIGLSVVKTVIKNHKGKVSASADEHGFTLTITL